MPRKVVVEHPAPPTPGAAIRVSVEGHAIAVFNLGPALRAIDAACTHVHGPLEQGKVDQGVVSCPWHGSEFDLATGAVRRGPAVQPVRTYPVQVEAGKIVLELP
ncbi:MAG TPA: Rieske 2Fe-2S domain-containing protein [Thermoplasmata archaeon]|jgi:nitrite reductase/ring-hydroxylating ferredoxin subunit|nr:Rieske 2Fe-2S domain-containing protein [Thermoplasmata archaeon]